MLYVLTAGLVVGATLATLVPAAWCSLALAMSALALWKRSSRIALFVGAAACGICRAPLPVTDTSAGAFETVGCVSRTSREYFRVNGTRLYGDARARPGDRVAVRGKGSTAHTVVVLRRGACAAHLARARDRWVHTLVGEMGDEAGGIAAAMVAGERGWLSEDLLEDFRTTGTVHVLVVSGLHLTMIMLIVSASFRLVVVRSRWARMTDTRWVSLLLGVVVAAAYIGYVGTAVPVLRAFVIGAIALFILATRRVLNPWRLWCAAMAILVWAHPPVVFEVGFQLSFAAVAGIIALRTSHYSRILKSLCATSGAILATAPLVAFHFQRVPAVGLVANAAVMTLLASVTLPLLLIATATHALWPSAAVGLLDVIQPLIDAARTSVAACAELPFATLAWRPSLLGVVAAYSSWVAWKRRARVVVIAALLAVVAVDTSNVRVHRNLEVTFLSVGHGDSTVVRAPDGAVLVVDGGSSYSRAVSDHVRHLRPTHLTVVATHDHDDHVGGLLQLNRTGVDEVWAPTHWRPPIESHTVREVRAGDAFDWHGVWVQVLHPGDVLPESVNDQSIVLRLRWRGQTVLLTGDIEAASERAMISQGTDLRADIVKIPHHGSPTSSTDAFIDAVDPTITVFSVGPSPWGFPDANVQQRWARTGAKLLRTDEGRIRCTMAANGQTARSHPRCRR